MRLPNLGKVLGLNIPESKYRNTQKQSLATLGTLAPQAQTLGQVSTAATPNLLTARNQQAGANADYYGAGFDKGGALRTSRMNAIGRSFDDADAKTRYQARMTGQNPMSGLGLNNFRRTSATIGAENDYLNQKMSMEDLYRDKALNVRTSNAGQNLGEATNSLGMQGNFLGQEFGMGGSLAQADEARKAQEFSRLMGMLQTGAGLAGGGAMLPGGGGMSSGRGVGGAEFSMPDAPIPQGQMGTGGNFLERLRRMQMQQQLSGGY